MFLNEDTQQNLASVRIFARSISGIAFLLILSSFFIPYEQLLAREAELKRLTYYFFCFSVVAVAGEYALRRQLPRFRKEARLFGILYALLFITGCMAVSFIPQHNPKNNMTMFLLGALCVAVVWSLTLRESLLLVVGVSVTFFAGIIASSLSTEQLLLNGIGSVFILTCFFVLSRMMYSYRVNHYLQLQRIEAQKQEIHQISKAKSEILGIVAHDLRSPLANIEMLVKQVKGKKLSLQREQHFLDLVLVSCQKSRTIINDLVELARIEQEERLQLQRANLNEFLAEVQEEWQQHITGNRRLDIAVPKTPLYVKLNKEKFQRVMDNLLTNAIKFTPESGHIQLSISRQEEHALLRITDNGIGVPQKLQPHLFLPFSKAGRSGLNGEASTGLGLSITRKLVEQHHGTIEIESEENRGTTFLIKLPVLADA